MNIVVATSGVGHTDRSALQQAVEQLSGEPLRCTRADAGVWVGATRKPTPVVGWAENDGEVGACYGSALRSEASASAAATDALKSGGATLLDGAPGGVVAIYAHVSEGRLIVGAGAGAHRLFLAHLSQGVAISSHLGVLATAFGSQLGIDRTYEDFMLGYGFLPGTQTVYNRIEQLRPGIRRNLSTNTDAPISVGTHSTDPHGVNSFDEAVDRLSQLFSEVMEEQAGADTRHAVLLGGLDSALVASFLRRMGHEVDTYTFGFGDPQYEQRNVDRVTAALGTTEHWVHVDAEMMWSGLQGFADISYQTADQPHYAVQTIAGATQIADAGFAHVWTGDGCDAVFLGYPTVSRRAELIRRLGSVPTGVKAAMQRILRWDRVEDHLGHVARMARGTLGNLDYEMPARGHLPIAYLDATALARLRQGEHPHQAESVSSVRRSLAEPFADLDPIRLAFSGNGVTGQSRAKVDSAVAWSGISQSTPFAHPKLKGFVSSLPTEYLRPEGMAAADAGKALLLEMIRRERLLPEVILTQPKQAPSDSPADTWYAGPLRQRILQHLDYLPFDWDRAYVESILRPKYAESVYRSRVSLSHHAFQAIGLLCTYASFAKRSS